MQRLVNGLVLSAIVFGSLNSAQAAGRKPVQPQPKRYQLVPMNEKIVVPRNGKPVVKETYTGYRDGFIPPALFYYGYPWNERTFGTGIYP